MKDIMIAAELEMREIASMATPAFEVEPYSCSSRASSYPSSSGSICRGSSLDISFSSRALPPLLTIKYSSLKFIVILSGLFLLTKGGFSKSNRNSIV